MFFYYSILDKKYILSSISILISYTMNKIICFIVLMCSLFLSALSHATNWGVNTYTPVSISKSASDIGEEIKTLYSSFCKAEILVTDIRTAEMSKVVENTFRDINIAYANELSMICAKQDIDIWNLINLNYLIIHFVNFF